MCGKPNPADAEICRYCHARLKPLRPGEAPQPKSTAELEGTLPPWMQNLRENATPDALPETGELPLDLTAGAEPAEKPLPPEEEEPAEDGLLWAPDEEEEDLPDWLKSLGGEANEAAESAPAAPEAEAPPAETPPPAPQPEAEGEPASPLAADEAELPDWLAGEATPAEETSAAEEAAGLPDWLAGEPQPEAEAEPAPVQPTPQPFVADAELPEDLLQETPDWLALLSPDEEPTGEAQEKPATAEEGEPSGALTAGELPSWLEAMRPIAATSVGGAGEDETIETEGPLAGLRGVITPPEPTLVKPGRVATIGGKLFLTDQQEAQAKTLQALLAEEFAPREPKKPPTLSRQRALRWFIGVVLLVMAFLPLVLPPLQAPPPDRILPAARAALQAVDTVPQGAPVLVGVDYSPAFAAEMETTAAPLLRDLLAKGARLTVVSTQPTGPALATRLFRQGLNAQEGQQYLNLGYLPGGTAGLFAFAQNPRLVFTHAAGHTRLWETPFLNTVHQMDDFAMVVVITEDADTARAWIEQVRPTLGAHTPLIALISAQAEPMIEPYYETASHQVAGVVTGMAGSLAYSAARGQQPEAPLRGQWSSYSYVVLFAALMVAAAGLYNLALGWKEAHARRALAAEAEMAEADSEEEEA